MKQSTYISKPHNISNLIYHFVCPVKYRKNIFNDTISQTLKEICSEISIQYEIHFLEVGIDQNHVHFLIQSIPKYSPTKIITIVKSLIARGIFLKHPEVKKTLRKGEFWTSGYFANTVSKFINEQKISNYVRNQGISEQHY